MEEIDNHMGRGGSLKAFDYYDKQMSQERGITIVDVNENRIDDAAALCDQAQKMCAAHSCFDPMRDVRVAVHRLMNEVHEVNEVYEKVKFEEELVEVD